MGISTVGVDLGAYIDLDFECLCGRHHLYHVPVALMNSPENLLRWLYNAMEVVALSPELVRKHIAEVSKIYNWSLLEESP